MLLCLLLTACSAAIAAAPTDIQHYLALRKKCAAASAKTSKDDPSASSGKIIEVRGRLSGMSKNGDRGCMIITTSSDGSFVIESDSLPSDSPGAQLACLVKVGDSCAQSLNNLSLVAYTYDADLVRIDEAAAKAAQAKAAQPRSAQTRGVRTPSSRGAEPARGASLSGDEMVRIYTNAIKGFNRKLSDSEAETVARSIIGFSLRYKLDARLVCAVILAESHFRLDATSRCGAQGLGQLMPGTAAGLGVSNAYDPVQNVYGSVRYIKGMLDRMSGNKQFNDLTWNDLALALAAYNAGPGAVRKHGGVPPFRETQNYVRRVTAIYKKLCGVSS